MRLNYLFDFYQGLLTPKQREYMDMYYKEDFSLVEISRLAKVSRQAVYDNIKRTEAILESYEDKLLLYSKFEQRLTLITKLEETILHSNLDRNTMIEQIQQIKELN